MLGRIRALWLALAIAGTIGLATAASAQERTKTAGGVRVYLGIIPSEIVRHHAPSHPEATAHGGPPRGAHSYHLIVAIFDAATGDRIENAKVAARVSSLGLTGPRKVLEPMKIADTVTYGNYFSLPGTGQYRIDVEVERLQGQVKLEFAYGH
jgi:hypothetical protein